jgi:ABC-2 type transport system permease protein
MSQREQTETLLEPQTPPAYAERRIGHVNWRGLYTLYLKEVWRFWKVITQTVLAPAVTTLLFMAIFTLAIGNRGRVDADIPFESFLAPGLIVMAVLQNAFANTSSSIMIAKVQGNIVDVLMPPLSAGELTFAYAMGGVTRGILVGLIVALALAPFLHTGLSHIWAVLYFSIGAALMLSLLGMLTGIWAEKFDHTAAITNFVITPLSFLSGTFYSIDRLPGLWGQVSQFNPFFYMIDGVRYGFIGRSDGSILTGVLVVAGLNLALWILCHHLFKSGYKLRA